MENKLDISALKKAAKSFDYALAFALRVEEKAPETSEFYEKEVARASVIQHFEFTYELCWKIMKRYIEIEIGSKANGLIHKELFRLSAESRLITSFDQWVEFHKARNSTSHVYNEVVAGDVYEIAKQFSGPLHDFITAIEQRL